MDASVAKLSFLSSAFTSTIVSRVLVRSAVDYSTGGPNCKDDCLTAGRWTIYHDYLAGGPDQGDDYSTAGRWIVHRMSAQQMMDESL